MKVRDDEQSVMKSGRVDTRQVRCACVAFKRLKVKALHGNPSQSYGASLPREK